MPDNRPSSKAIPPGVVIEPSSLADVDELLRLYFTVYGNTYPIAMGTDRQVMSSVISAGNDLWLVARDTTHKRIAASAVVEIDRVDKIGKLAAVVSHPDYRKCGIASLLVRTITEQALRGPAPINSVYATTRTISMGPS